MKKRRNTVTVLLLLILSACAAIPEPEGDGQRQTEAGSETVSETMAESPARDLESVRQEDTTMIISVKSGQYEIIYELNDSTAARQLYAQLPLTTGVEPFSDNEMTFYPEKLDVTDAPLSNGKTGSLSYYEPWGDVVLFYAPCTPNSSLYELGKAVSGVEYLEKLSGTITVSAVEERGGL